MEATCPPSATSASSLLLLASDEGPSTRRRAARELCHRVGSTPAARAALLEHLGDGGEEEEESDERLAGPPLVLDPDYRAAAVETPLLAAPAWGSGALVETEHARRCLRLLSLSLELRRPVLLSGPPGAGKSTLLSALALAAGQHDKMVTVHLDEQVDSRSLLGAYVCGSTPGEFVWQPGVVAQAAVHGRWLLLEDVDRAPLEVMSALAPLLERGVLFVPGRGTSHSAAQGFRLFGTVTSTGASLAEAAEAELASARLSLSGGRAFSSRELFRPELSLSDGVLAIERVAASVALGEPLLLVGETGTGKTTVVQQLASMLGQKLLVHNLSQQSDASELVGGYRPVQPRHVYAPFAARFEDLFCRTFSRSKNGPFLSKLAQRLAKGEWARLVAMAEWESFAAEAGRLRHQLRREAQGGVDMREAQGGVGGAAFAFVEGALVQAVREGHWLLLDEVNLAAPETLQRVAGLLEAGGSLALTEKGEADAVPRHPNFRLFAAMNPPTDFGKKELPAGIRSRLTELYVPRLSSPEDLSLIVIAYLGPLLPSPPVGPIVAFYQAALDAAATTLLDGADQRPEYSLRTLCRALSYVRAAVPLGYGLHRCLYDGFHITFVAQLQARFQPQVEALLLRHLMPPKPNKPPRPPPARAPARPSGDGWVEIGGFWLQTDPRHTASAEDPRFIVTPSIEARFRQLARMVAAGRYPVLLQGPTSAGKTSVIERLAAATGHVLLRINNHEHTDLVFRDGALTTAVRHGHWVVLDELNLAQSEVLEALNRLLDDNRELHIPETGETLTPHAHFMLFATQNPPGAYGGRKVLSRAFRNRFLEMQTDEIPAGELTTILERRCAICTIPPGWYR
ncbi:hypothetical protein EMIHUDRAFT_220866 [Emiliania huxleyi CCMP1516]|uniref:Midasin n=2 Tax=Emiliania huxleyi TaxID=2903 RepID=A0A0D3I0E1_EMIH1|nr:hypothetical protein EMIHUDRAFT_220866 [Emiliania huxleyi CCMP1516]EOD04726.1 hypothetical protein EMIHUDRAFT_220866 [Emiliania huxleyi CCMP1516]|eukprot:XP_005757155.1 hypothetical protein EMIHUDRAFT_220866 [Emiliania huxleyi CCMP1516]